MRLFLSRDRIDLEITSFYLHKKLVPYLIDINFDSDSDNSFYTSREKTCDRENWQGEKTEVTIGRQRSRHETIKIDDEYD